MVADSSLSTRDQTRQFYSPDCMKCGLTAKESPSDPKIFHVPIRRYQGPDRTEVLDISQVDLKARLWPGTCPSIRRHAVPRRTKPLRRATWTTPHGMMSTGASFVSKHPRKRIPKG